MTGVGVLFAVAQVPHRGRLTRIPVSSSVLLSVKRRDLSKEHFSSGMERWPVSPVLETLLNHIPALKGPALHHVLGHYGAMRVLQGPGVRAGVLRESSPLRNTRLSLKNEPLGGAGLLYGGIWARVTMAWCFSVGCGSGVGSW